MYTSQDEVNAIIRLIERYDCRSVAEFGVNHGVTAAAVLRQCPQVRRYAGIDVPARSTTVLPRQRHQVPDVAGKHVLGDPRVHIIVRPNGTHDLTPEDLGKVDLVFIDGTIDGDHSDEGVRRDTALARQIAVKVIVWHDYNKVPSVTDFLNRLEPRPVVVQGTWLCYQAVDAGGIDAAAG